MKNLGFTLLELMVAILILAILSLVATGLFLNAVRGGTKVDVGTEVKQNGQFALNTMEQKIRSSTGLISCDAASLSLTDKNNQSLVFSCEDVAGDTYIAENGTRLTSNKVVMPVCGFSCSVDVDGVRPPLITINFTVAQVGTVGKAEAATADFSTSVSLRNY